MSDKVGTDPSIPFQICLDFKSVHAAAFRLRRKEPDGDWIVVGKGTHNDDELCFDVPEMPWGSVIEYRFLYTDDGDDAEFEVEVSVKQEDAEVECSPVTITGEGGAFGIEGEIELVDDCEE